MKLNFKQISRLTIVSGFCALFTGFAPISLAATARRSPQTHPSLSRNNTIADATNACRRAIAPDGLNVRQKPWGDSPLIGEIPFGETLSIDNLGDNGWVAISSPYEGYVRALNIGYCDRAVSPPLQECREIGDPQGLTVRARPRRDSEIVAQLTHREQVAIENLGDNGWVPIYSPFSGYVRANGLEDCTDSILSEEMEDR
jgi:uncharacterized protein YgiM (DUF1202 family)